jgi:hypothetical protein
MRILTGLLFSTLVCAQGPGVVKPGNSDIIKLSFYCDNWAMIFINGKIVAVNSIDFLPHNEVTVNILPDYPMTIAVLAKDNADPKTGLEYGNHIGDGGFILKLGDGTVSDATWKGKSFFSGPLNSDINNPTVQYTPIPPNWFAPEFDDSAWDNASVFASDVVRPDGTYNPADFTGASFIWTKDLLLDNTLILRRTVQAPKGYTKIWNTVPDLNIKTVFSEAQLATIPTPTLFTGNAAGLALGYVKRVRAGQTTYEEINQDTDGGLIPLPIDLGTTGDEVFLTLYANNQNRATSGTANVAGRIIPLSYAGPQGGTPGLAQFVIPLPASLAGQGTVPVSVTAGGSTSNTVLISVR